jgi:hypothetical protein
MCLLHLSLKIKMETYDPKNPRDDDGLESSPDSGSGSDSG